jgi:hypothetical protein
MKKFRIDLAAVLVLAAGTATAGGVWHYAGCYTNPDGSGYCYGSFQGFRDQSYAKSYAEFQEVSDGSRSFGAVYQNPYSGNITSAWCIPDASVAALWPEAMNHNGYFHINFTAGGVCNRLTLTNGSAYYH